jgi:hypothetical protein
MLPSYPGAVQLQDPIAMLAHDVGHLEGWPRHRLCNRRVRRTVSAAETAIASSGLATACRCRCDTCREMTVCSSLTWPSRSCPVRQSAPASTRCEAYECRKRWGDTRFSNFAR